MKRTIIFLVIFNFIFFCFISCEKDMPENFGVDPDEYNNIEEEHIEENDPYEDAVKLVEDYKRKILDRYPAAAEDENVVDIILFCGQSNSSGRATKDEIEAVGDDFVTVDKSKAFTFYNDQYVEPMAIEEPISGNGTEEQFYGYIPSFLNTYYDVTGRKACACFKSVGGMMMNVYFPYTVDDDGNEIDEPQKYYNQMVEYITFAKNNLIANGYTTGHIFMVWCQGESDSEYYGYENEYANVIEEKITEYDDKVNYYKKSFTRIFESLKNDAGVEKAFIVRLGHSNNRKEALTNQCIIEAQSELCLENPDIVMVSTFFAGAKCYRTEKGETVNLMRDDSHYYLEAYLKVGKEAATNAGIYVNSNFSQKPILVEYHNVYLKSQGIIDDTEYENESERYIYRQ